MGQCPYCGDEIEIYGEHIREKHSISCEEVRDNFTAYSRGKLDEETDERIICHLSNCGDCMAVLQKFGKK